MIIASLQLGLIYSLLALGVYITFRILNIPDLTADGSFTLGLSVSAIYTYNGKYMEGLFLAIIAGMLAGAFTGILQTKLKIHPILSGILTMSGLYSVNLFVLGSRSNISLMGVDTLFTNFNFGDKNTSKLVLVLAITIISVLALIWFLNTHLGLCVRATGSNESMVLASSINANLMKVLALAIANGFVSLSGAVLAQYQGYADISSGTGIVTIGLASVIIGECFFCKKSLKISIIGAVFGSIIYRFIITFAIQNDIFPAYMLKLVSALIVIIALSVPVIIDNIKLSKVKKEAMKNAKIK